jgi:hypothetical protein
MKTKPEYIESLALELKEWSAQIDYLFAKAENAGSDFKLKCVEELEGLRTKQNAAAEKMKESEETSELKEWSAQLELLAAEAGDATADVKLNDSGELEVLRTKQHAAAEKIKELEEASADAWETVKESADKVWDDLRTGLARTASKLN